MLTGPRYFKYLISKGKIGKLRFKINNGRVIVEEVSDLNDLKLNQEVVEILENNNDLKDDALFVAQKKWSDLIVDSCIACLIEARKLADLKHPKTGYEYDVTVTIDGGSASYDVNGFKINKENDAMDESAKKMNDFVEKVKDTADEFTIVQAFKEATLEFEKETPKEKK